MNRMKWMLPVVVGVVVLGLLWWFTRSRTYTAQDLMGRDNASIVLIFADLDEQQLVRLKQELVQLRRQPAGPAEGAEAERVLALAMNAIRMRGIDEKKFAK